MSPTAAVTLFGEYARVPFAFPTFTTWTLTVPVDVEDEAEEVLEAAEYLLGDAFIIFLGCGLTKSAANAQGRQSKICQLHFDEVCGFLIST